MEFQNFLKFDGVKREDLPFAMAQYYDFKTQYRDFILLFKVGGFYETYFEDALEFSNCAGINLTRKKLEKTGWIPMAGIPRKALDLYVQKLVNSGYKVVVVEQTNERKSGGLIRKVSKVYTGGTLIEPELLNAKENNYLAAVYKKNNKYEICYADISVGEVFASFGSLEKVKCELDRICPRELLILENESAFNSRKTEILPEEAFIEGAQGALLYYAKKILKEYIPKLETPKNYSIDENLLIDFMTRKNLELTKNSFNNKKYGSLLWALDRCKTPMGKRLLSFFISCPLYNLEEIKKRQEGVREFLNNPEIADRIGALLENIGDIARLASRLSNGTATPFEFLTLRGGLSVLNELEELTAGFKSEILAEKNQDTKLLLDFYKIISDTIEDDPDLIKAGKYIKDGANPELDLLNIQYKKAQAEISDYGGALRELTGIKALKIINKTGNRLIEVPAGAINSLPDEFKTVQILKNSRRYTTGKLIALEDKVYSLEAKIKDTGFEIYANLSTYSKEMTKSVRKYSKRLAILDVLFSAYKVAHENNLNCPVLNSPNFEIKEGRHLAAEKILGGFEPLNFSFENSNFIMLTGQNGIGKSTLLKEIATVIILAQSGFFVPCKEAKLPLVDRLFTILNISDELINKKSAHQAQMREVARILQLKTDKSVILLDEIGKSTSYKEGVSISYGLIRYFLEETSAKTVFATHYLSLYDMLKEIQAKISYFEIANINGKREIREGIAPSSGGICSAKAENLPDKILEYAKYALEYV